MTNKNRPRGNQIEPAPTLTDKNRVDRVRGRIRIFPENPKWGRGHGITDIRPNPNPPEIIEEEKVPKT